MNPVWRNIALTTLFALLAAGAGAWIGAHYVVAQHSGGSSLHAIVHKGLKLTPEQDQRLAEIERSYATQRETFEDEIRSANRQLAQAIQESQQNSPTVQSAVDHLHLIMGMLQKATVAHIFEMRAVLTPEQAKMFDVEIAAALTDEDR